MTRQPSKHGQGSTVLYSSDKIVMIGQRQQVRQDRTSSKGHTEPVSQDKTDTGGQPGKYGRDQSMMTGQLGQTATARRADYDSPTMTAILGIHARNAMKGRPKKYSHDKIQKTRQGPRHVNQDQNLPLFKKKEG